MLEPKAGTPRIEEWSEKLSPKLDRRSARLRKHRRVRKKVFGTPERPRLSVFRSIKHIYAQIIDDQNGITLVSASTLSPAIRDKIAANSSSSDIETAKAVGEAIGRKAKEKSIAKVVFDKGGYRYHGRVKALADAARNAGLEF
jgi:large subunit ribosomal protein L18